MITLYKGYNYDNSYEYVKLFTTKEEQKAYFNSLQKIVIDETEYIKNNMSFMVEYDYDELMSEGVNYLTYDNGYKTYYAFIVLKEYTRKNVTQLHFEIDVLQTFQFDFKIKNSFVERKVCTIDEITDFDEGIYIDEHVVEYDNEVLQKETNYFAMFNGIKQQQLTFTEKGTVDGIINFPFPTEKPMTLLDGIQYPIYFMPLKEIYSEPVKEPIKPPVDGDGVNIVESARKMIGKPYVWGGNYPPLGTDNGTDCSGLIMWACNDCGVIDYIGIGGRWTTYTMFSYCPKIQNLRQAKIGDVIFSNFNSEGKPEHVVLISLINEIDNKVTIIEAQQTGTNIMERTINFNSDPSRMIIGRLTS